MTYKNTNIYYTSGTGNSRRISTWLGKILEKKGSKTRVLEIKDSNPAKEIKSGADQLLGIVFPTHGFTMSWNILKFVWRLPRRKSTHAVCVASGASFKIGPVVTPSLTGTGTFLLSLILWLKGYKVQGVQCLNMPSHWFTVHPIQGDKTRETIMERAKHNINLFIERILNGKKSWFNFTNIRELIIGLILSPLSLFYLLIIRFFIAKLFFSNTNCTGCGICADGCPFHAIKMWGKKNPRPFWKYNCENCMKCAGLCPYNAIESGQSWGVIMYFIITLPASLFIFSTLGKYFPGLVNLGESTWLKVLVGFLYCYPAIFIPYYIFHLLMRITPINWLFTHTTMTHFSFWRRYRETENVDIPGEIKN